MCVVIARLLIAHKADFVFHGGTTERLGSRQDALPVVVVVARDVHHGVPWAPLGRIVGRAQKQHGVADIERGGVREQPRAREHVPHDAREAQRGARPRPEAAHAEGQAAGAEGAQDLARAREHAKGGRNRGGEKTSPIPRYVHPRAMCSEVLPLQEDFDSLGLWFPVDQKQGRRKRAREDPLHHVARTCQCGCHDRDNEPRLAAWVRAARRHCEELHRADTRQGLARLVGEEFGPPHLASLLVGQMQLCLVCGEHMPSPSTLLESDGDVVVERFLENHTHSYANCFAVHRRCQPEAHACVAGLGADLLDLLARNLADERFRALSVNTSNVVAGHYDPAALEQLVL